MAAVGCLAGIVSLASQAGTGAGLESPKEKGSPHVLVLAAETLTGRRLPKASAVAVRLARATPTGEAPARSLLRLVDELYRELQFDGAGAALQLAGHCQPIAEGDRAQLALRHGLLRMESFDEKGARRSFQEALGLDRTAQLPGFAPPKTADLLEEIRGALPPPTAPAASAAPVVPSTRALLPASAVSPVGPAAPASAPASLHSWAWAPAAGGAALGVTGGVLYLRAKASYDLVARHDPSLTTLEQVHATVNDGRALQTGAFVLFGLGAAALASAAVLGLSGDALAVQASVQVGSGGAGVVIAGALP